MTRADRLLSVAVWGLALLSGIVVYQAGPLVGGDTPSYVNDSIIRPPGYPLVLNVFQFVFGHRYASFVVVVQIAAVLFAAIRFTSIVASVCGLNAYGSLAVFLVAASPVWTLTIGNYLLTEAIAYTLFLVSVSLILRLSGRFELGTFGWLAGVVALNTLVRPQMVFMYGVCLALTGQDAVHHRSVRKVVKAVGVLAMAALVAAGVDRGYNAVVRGIPATSFMTGLVLARDALYVSRGADVSVFRDAWFSAATQNIFSDMDRRKLFAGYRFEQDKNLAQYLGSAVSPDRPYTWRSDTILLHTMARHLYSEIERRPMPENAFTTVWFDGDHRTWVRVNAAAWDIARTLIALRPFDYGALIASRLMHHVAVYEPLLLCVVIALPFVRQHPVSTFLGMTAAAHVLNLLVVATTNEMLDRYTFYTETLIMVAIVVAWNAAIGRKAQG